jgi:hypothetical protein
MYRRLCPGRRGRGIAVNAAPRMMAIEKPAARPSSAPAMKATPVYTGRPVFTEWQQAFATTCVVFQRLHLADPMGQIGGP